MNMKRGEYFITENGTVEVCVHGRAPTYDAMFDFCDRIISFTLNLVSIFSLTTTLITYILFKELRNLPGLNLMCLAVSILISRVVFMIGERKGVQGLVICNVVAVIIHFTTLATFFWTNIMAWDIYKTFGQRTVLSHIRPKGYFFEFQ